MLNIFKRKTQRTLDQIDSDLITITSFMHLLSIEQLTALDTYKELVRERSELAPRAKYTNTGAKWRINVTDGDQLKLLPRGRVIVKHYD